MDQAIKLRSKVAAEGNRKFKANSYKEHGSSSPIRVPRVIAVTSGKGGVGKTNVTGNLAIACQRIGKKVLIFDADLGLANIDIIFGLNPKHTVDEVIRGEKELSDIIVIGPEGVAVMPATSGVQKLAHLTEGQKMNLLCEFDALNERFDIVLIDTSAGISSNVIFFNLAAQERIIVATPEPTSIADAYALIKVLFHQHKTKNFILLTNMVWDEHEARLAYQNLSTRVARSMPGVFVDYGGFIPWDKALQQSVNNRIPVLSYYPESSSSKSFKQLAQFILQQTQSKPMDGNIKFFWKSLMTREEEHE